MPLHACVLGDWGFPTGGTEPLGVRGNFRATGTFTWDSLVTAESKSGKDRPDLNVWFLPPNAELVWKNK